MIYLAWSTRSPFWNSLYHTLLDGGRACGT
jgi:hypothetical protein